jgi:Leucine-rich repeat (LRR) protein
LLLSIPKKRIRDYDDIGSIDEASERLSRRMEFGRSQLDIPPETEFWGHCSNIQAWAENNYDTRILHRSLSFPLLKKLSEAGDPIAKQVFKEEIASRLESGYPSVIGFLSQRGYINILNEEEFKSVVEDTNMLDNLMNYLGFTSRGSSTDINRIMEKANRVSHDFVKEKMASFLNQNDLYIYRGLARLNYFQKMDFGEKIKLLKDCNSMLYQFFVEYKEKDFFLKGNMSLNLSKRGIKDMREIRGIRRLKHLKALDLSNNMITDIHGLENCKNLIRLKLRGNPLPKELLDKLGGLKADGNAKKPKNFIEYCQNKESNNVQTVSVNGLEFDAYNGELYLKYLGIQDLSEIEGLQKLENLKILDLSYNELTNVKGLENFTSLKVLNLQNNRLLDTLGLEKLRNLEELRLYRNDIHDIPKFEHFKKLKKLYADSHRPLSNKKYLRCLLQSFTVKHMKKICQELQLIGYTRLIHELESDIVSKGIAEAIKKISTRKRNPIRKITMTSGKEPKIDILSNYSKGTINSQIKFNPNNISNLKWMCECKNGSGFCPHFWIGLIFALKQGLLNLENWKLTKLPANFKNTLKKIQIVENNRGEKQLIIK